MFPHNLHCTTLAFSSIAFATEDVFCARVNLLLMKWTGYEPKCFDRVCLTFRQVQFDLTSQERWRPMIYPRMRNLACDCIENRIVAIENKRQTGTVGEEKTPIRPVQHILQISIGRLKIGSSGWVGCNLGSIFSTKCLCRSSTN